MVTGADGRLSAKEVRVGGGVGGVKRAANGMSGPGSPAKKQVKGSRQIHGIIKSFNAGKGFGFISSDACPGDMFFMKSDVQGDAASFMSPGMPVSCQIQQGPDGRMRAINITVG